MLTFAISSALFVCLIAAVFAQAEAAPSGLKSRWTKDVSPTLPHPEYPRPRMARRAWLNLNGKWRYRILDQTPGASSRSEGSILVPFPIESALSGVGARAEKIRYSRKFTVSPSWKAKRVLLHFGAVDWEAKVSVNGVSFPVHRGGYDGFSFDITDALKGRLTHELQVDVFDPTDAGDQPRGKQVNRPEGIWYTPSTGIWQTVWLEAVPAAYIADLTLTPDVDRSSLAITVHGSEASKGMQVRMVALDGNKIVGEARGVVGKSSRIRIPEPKLWSPASPFLYRLKVELFKNDKRVDAVDSYFGMRKIAVASDGKVTRLMLNGKFEFQLGVLDQGFWPDGLYTAPTDEALKFDVQAIRKLGMNLIRKHVKVEPERWYYWADKLGVLVWQDMPNGNNRTAEGKQQFERELKRLIEGRRNHPSIITWVVFNEGWGQYDTERITEQVRRWDPTRLVNNPSGWTDRGVGDMMDIHVYPGPASPKPETNRAAVLGEFGGLGLHVAGHMWSKEGWGYQGMTDSAQLTDRYLQLLRRIWRLKDDPGLSAAVYTQTTDVEIEVNGLFTYDREVFKMDEKRVREANLVRWPPETVTVVVPTAQSGPIEWRYTFEKPGDNWYYPGYDDSEWQTGLAGFGTEGTPGSTVRTMWNGPTLWIRRVVELPSPLPPGLMLVCHHDEDVAIYINGVLAARASGFTTDYDEMPLTSAARTALKPGANVIAASCIQTRGGQYLDIGLVNLQREQPRRR